ncbi:MAG: hypothetical protein WCH34_05930 [Bacteroidota bacterium]
MRNITANAILNLKEEPATLYVHGSIMTYHGDDKVVIKKAVPQGINPKILLLKLTIKEGAGPMKGTPKAFKYINKKPEARTYKQVQILYPDSSLTIKVEVYGK